MEGKDFLASEQWDEKKKETGGGEGRGKERMDGEEEGERARFTLQTTEERTRSGKLGGAPDTTLPSENLANKRRKQERGETPLSGGGEGLRKSKGR